jgi:hypothetical protein
VPPDSGMTVTVNNLFLFVSNGGSAGKLDGLLDGNSDSSPSLSSWLPSPGICVFPFGFAGLLSSLLPPAYPLELAPECCFPKFLAFSPENPCVV